MQHIGSTTLTQIHTHLMSVSSISSSLISPGLAASQHRLLVWTIGHISSRPPFAASAIQRGNRKSLATFLWWRFANATLKQNVKRTKVGWLSLPQFLLTEKFRITGGYVSITRCHEERAWLRLLTKIRRRNFTTNRLYCAWRSRRDRQERKLVPPPRTSTWDFLKV